MYTHVYTPLYFVHTYILGLTDVVMLHSRKVNQQHSCHPSFADFLLLQQEKTKPLFFCSAVCTRYTIPWSRSCWRAGETVPVSHLSPFLRPQDQNPSHRGEAPTSSERLLVVVLIDILLLMLLLLAPAAWGRGISGSSDGYGEKCRNDRTKAPSSSRRTLV